MFLLSCFCLIEWKSRRSTYTSLTNGKVVGRKASFQQRHLSFAVSPVAAKFAALACRVLQKEDLFFFSFHTWKTPRKLLTSLLLLQNGNATGAASYRTSSILDLLHPPFKLRPCRAIDRRPGHYYHSGPAGGSVGSALHWPECHGVPALRLGELV